MTAPRPVLVVHGVATRDRERFESDVERLGGALGPGVRTIPCYWGDLVPDPDDFDRILPYLRWADDQDPDDDDDPPARRAAVRPWPDAIPPPSSSSSGTSGGAGPRPPAGASSPASTASCAPST